MPLEYDQERRQQVLALYVEGVGQREIARRTGVAGSTVHRWIHDAKAVVPKSDWWTEAQSKELKLTAMRDVIYETYHAAEDGEAATRELYLAYFIFRDGEARGRETWRAIYEDPKAKEPYQVDW
jgi:transposase-like protein